MHAFCRPLIISKSTFSKNSFKNTIGVPNSLDPDQAPQKVGLIGVQTVCKGYQQTTPVGSELIVDIGAFIVNGSVYVSVS